MITAEAVSKTFPVPGLFRRRAVHAVTDVSLSIAPGEALGLVGESGSGKSTLGRLLLNLIPPTAGRVLVDGQDLARLGPSGTRRLRRRMQLVFQDPYSSLDPRRRIGAQVADGLAIHGMDQTGRVAALLDQVGLASGHASRFPHEFSGGQRQRIAIARALATRPDLLVADEPVSALDVSVQAQVLGVLADLRTRLNLALLFISHDLTVVRSLCDRVAVLYLGRVMEQGPAAQVFHAPLHPYTQALLSAVPSLDPAHRRTGRCCRANRPALSTPPPAASSAPAAPSPSRPAPPPSRNCVPPPRPTRPPASAANEPSGALALTRAVASGRPVPRQEHRHMRQERRLELGRDGR